jgi:hypothetical protein
MAPPFPSQTKFPVYRKHLVQESFLSWGNRSLAASKLSIDPIIVAKDSEKTHQKLRKHH